MARIRSTRFAKSGTLPEAVDYRHLWRQLREAGWSSRWPNSLETALTYVEPGASAYGAIGVDVFLGEAAVVDHIIKSGLQRVDHEVSALFLLQIASNLTYVYRKRLVEDTRSTNLGTTRD
ncbi:hypothetical protein PHMEG_00034172 [Phytophthora megakarya]|uniref:Uncharacterized protein n=1 Tax=Phytophthora megakarya TaxID=4795 RepID=A0A225URL0_9STRA|nr:hypothetical protein PHMEG_00034172 [Phytophthora megakarya]